MTTELLTLPLRVAAFLALVGSVCWPLELLYPRIAPRLSLRAWLVDVSWLTLGALTLTLVVGPVLRWVQLDSTPAWWRLGLAMLGAEFASYGVHRAMHEVPWLRRFHAVHHEPVELDWLKAWRQHPLDVALHALAVGLPGALLGAPLSSLAALVLLRRLYTSLLHANVNLRFGWLEHVVATPHFHHMHHHHGAANFAGLFPWIDRLFGTHTRHLECRQMLPRRAVP